MLSVIVIAACRSSSVSPAQSRERAVENCKHEATLIATQIDNEKLNFDRATKPQEIAVAFPYTDDYLREHFSDHWEVECQRRGTGTLRAVTKDGKHRYVVGQFWELRFKERKPAK